MLIYGRLAPQPNGRRGADYLWLSWVRCEVVRVVAKNFRGWPASLKLGYAVSLIWEFLRVECGKKVACGIVV